MVVTFLHRARLHLHAVQDGVRRLNEIVVDYILCQMISDEGIPTHGLHIQRFRSIVERAIAEVRRRLGEHRSWLSLSSLANALVFSAVIRSLRKIILRRAMNAVGRGGLLSHERLTSFLRQDIAAYSLEPLVKTLWLYEILTYVATALALGIPVLLHRVKY